MKNVAEMETHLEEIFTSSGSFFLRGTSSGSLELYIARAGPREVEKVRVRRGLSCTVHRRLSSDFGSVL